MGLFSNEYVTNVGTQVIRIMPDKSIVPSPMVGMVKNQNAEYPQMMEFVMEEMSGSLAHKGERMYSYAKKNYTNGLPSGKMKTAVDGMDKVQAAISSERGGSAINIDYIQVGPPNLQHRGWMALVSQLTYDPITNKLGSLTASKGTDVFLSDMVVVVRGSNLKDRDPSTVAQWGPPATNGFTPDRLGQVLGSIGKMRDQTKFEVDPNAANDYVRVEFCYIGADKKIVKDKMNIQLLPLPDGDYYQVRYDYGTGLALTSFWMYKVGTGTYPEVDKILTTTYGTPGSYFPMAYIRYAKKSASEIVGTPEYKTSERMLKMMGMNFKDMTKQINDNPGIKDVEQAIVAFMVPAVTENQVEQMYLFDYFKQLHYASAAMTPLGPQTKPLFQIVDKMFPNLQQSKTIIIEDKKFKMALSFTLTTQEIKVGNVCPVGKYKSFFTEQTKTENPALTTGGKATYTTIEKRHVYQHQIAKGLYEEVSVFGLNMVYFVYQGYTTVGTDKDPTLLIPLDNSITRKYTTLKREELYARSMHLIINSRVVTVLKWYQQKWFSIFLVIIAIVVTIVSLGTAWQSIVAALAAGASAYAIAYMIFIAILKYLIVSYIVKLFVKLVGVKFALLAAIVAAVASAYTGNAEGAQGLQGSPWATELLQVSSNLAKGVQDNIAESMANLKQEADRYRIYTDTQTKLLDDANKLLESDNKMIPLIIWGEKPDDFYNRTVHSGNVGVLGLDAIESFCDIRLKLPEIQDTIGADNNGLPDTSFQF